MTELTYAPGFRLAKPIWTQEACDAYSAMAQAVNAHNDAAAVGEVLWGIADTEDWYEVVEDGVVEAAPEPPAAEPEKPKLRDRVDALEAALEDADALNVDQEYRLTLLELGLTE